MLRKIRRFFGEYKQLAVVALSIILGAGLDLAGQDSIAHWVLGISAIVNIFPLVWGMIEAVRDGSYGLDVLAITAIVTAVILGEYWAGIIVVLMLTGGEAIEDYAEKRAKRELTSLIARRPRKAHLMRGKNMVDVKLSQISVGDRIMILPGEVVPVDGIIIDGSSSFDESDLTGESLPLPKDINDYIMSGSLNMEGAITIKATSTAEDSQYEQIIKLVNSASASQSPFVRLTDRYSIPFTAVSFLIAGATWFVSGDPVRFLEVLVVATPCPLLLGAPIALISGMSRAAKLGIIVKTGSALERLAEVETIAFDKTGTLTTGVPVVNSIETYNKFTVEQVLSYAGALEQSSTHVLAKAIVDKASSEKIRISPAKQVKETPGHGLTGRLHGNTLLVGRLIFMQESGVAIPTTVSNKSITKTASFVAVDGKLAGIITFIDQLRPEAKDTLRVLKNLNIKHTLVVTGDNQAVADAIGKELGIEKVIGDCLPGDKIHAIEQVLNKPVAFVGDGVNDAPVLTAADVGIALGARGSTAASESADVVIMLDDLSKIATSIAIAKRTFAIARQSILIGIFISIGLMAVFSTGRFKAVQGAAIQELVDITVIINALRAHTSGRKSKRIKS